MEEKRKRGRPLKVNKFGPSSPYFPSMKAAAHSLKIDIALLRDARSKDCHAFRTGGFVHRDQLIQWLKDNPPPIADKTTLLEESLDDFKEEYKLKDEVGGVGQTLVSLRAYERRCKRDLDNAERITGLFTTEKAKLIKDKQDGWLKVARELLRYDLEVDQAKRESGEQIAKADAIKGVHALLAWHSVAMSDALRNALPECEMKSRNEVAAILDPLIRSSIYRNFKLAVKLGKIPDWMGKEASDFVKQEGQPKPSLNVDDY